MATNSDPLSDDPGKVVSRISESAGARASAKMGAAMLQGSSHVAPSAAIDRYAYRWRELRRRQVRALCATASCLTASILGLCLLPSNITRCGVIMVAMAMTVPAIFALNAYPCPRCKKPFFERSDEERLNYFARQCVHCGLMIGTSKADAVGVLDEPEIRIIG
jgi:hypothetical protein